MDPLDFIELPELQQFYVRNKTELSCLEGPQTLLHLLRDHNLIPEDMYKKVIRMRTKQNLQNGLYGALDWLEREHPQHIKLFWSCVFKDSMLSHYPTLRLMRNSLMDGSIHFYEKLPEKVEKTIGDGEGHKKRGKTVKSQPKGASDQEVQQPGPSALATPTKRSRLQKPSFGSTPKKGEKAPIWTWPLYRAHLPVKCGNVYEAMLDRRKLAQGEKCILVDGLYLSPPEFEALGGKKHCKNWKSSIRCLGTPLQRLIKDGHLKCPGFKQRRPKVKKMQLTSSQDSSSDTACLEGLPPNGRPNVRQRVESHPGATPEATHQRHVRDTKALRHLTISQLPPESDSHSEDSDSEDSDSSSQTGVPLRTVGEEDAEEEAEDEGVAEEGEGSSRDSSDDRTVFTVTCGALTGTLHKARFASGTCGKSIRTETSWMSPAEFVKEGSAQPDSLWKKDILCEGRPLNVLLETKVLELHWFQCRCRLCRPDHEALEDEKNDDVCFICKKVEEGELVVCERCPRSFHQRCHLPPVEDAMLGDGSQWLCTFCVLKITHKYSDPSVLTHETALLCPISDKMLECQHLALSLYTADEDRIFATDPCLQVSGYRRVIQTPMWLDKVVEKLQTRGYNTVGEFVLDIRLIFTNCAKFNRDNAEFRANGVILSYLFEKNLVNVFRIQQ